MEFNVNHPLIYVIVAIILLVVLAQSVFFLVRAVKRGRELGITKDRITKTISSSAIFSIAPAVAILVGVLSLSKALGTAVPWLRLSVIGSLSYEVTAAGVVLGKDQMGLAVTNPSIFVSALFVMTFGIAIGLFVVPLFGKKIHSGVQKIEGKDKAWGKILNSAMFIGMISAFLGFVFSDVSDLWTKGSTAGLIPVAVMIFSALVMAILGLFATKGKQKWLQDYALPISLVSGMAMAIPFTMWLG